jgi:hypothetical protein
MKINIRVWADGAFTDREVDALPAGVPGLAVHRAHEGGGMVISHIKTGAALAAFPGDVFDCAEALGNLGDWQETPDAATRAAAAGIIRGYDAFVDQVPAPHAVLAAEHERIGVPGAA